LRSAAPLLWTFAVVGCVPPEPADDDDTTAGDDDACADVLRDETVAIDPGGPDTQIHGAAAFDGEGIWIAYNRPRDDGWFDVYATRIACDGSVLVEPWRLNEDDGANHVDPALAVDGDAVLVAWHRDDGQFPHNLSTWVRGFDLDGNPAGAAMELATTWDGEPLQGNVWMPAVAARPGEGLVVAGVRGLPDLDRFQVYLQPVDTTGQPTAETVNPDVDGAASDSAPALAATADGRLALAWTRTPDDGDDAVVRLTFEAGSWAPDGDPAEVAPGEVTGGAALDGPHLGWHRETLGGYAVHAVSLDGGDGMELGHGDAFDHTPALAATDDGGAVTWLRVDQGIRNDLFVTRYAEGGDSLDAGAPAQVETDGPVGPYAPDLVHLTGDVWFAVWAEGESPAFRLVGRYLDLEE